MAFDKLAYQQYKYTARKRGVPFLLTYDQWRRIWQLSGKTKGRLGHEYCMARKGDRGPYAVGNVRIITNRQNVSESWANGDRKARAKKIAASQTGRVHDLAMVRRRNKSIGKTLNKKTWRTAQSKRMTAWWEARRV